MQDLVTLEPSVFEAPTQVLCNLCHENRAKVFCTKTVNGFSTEFTFVQCEGCGLVFLNPRPSLASLDQLYNSKEYFQGKDKAIGYFDYLSEESFRRQTAAAKIKEIERALGRKGRLLEIGCAAGFFLAAARDAGWEVSGLDISEPMIQYARESYKLDAWIMRFEDLDLATHLTARQGSYDVIACWGTTGTFLDPVGNFLKVHNLLKDDGLFVFNASDSDSLLANLMGSRWYCLQPSAAHAYNRRVLLKMLSQTGFDLVRLQTDRHHITLYKVMTQRQVARGRFVEWIASLVRELPLAHKPFLFPNLGFIECYARKSRVQGGNTS